MPSSVVPSAGNGAIRTLPEELRSAASRVLALPELLEIILDFCSFKFYDAEVPQALGNPDAKSSTRFSGPAVELFCLQRVSRNFQATIARSKLLQQRMCLTASPKDRKIVSWSALVWLAPEMDEMSHYGFSLPREVTNEVDVNIVFRLSGNYGQGPDPRYAAWLRPEASWRRMRVWSRDPVSTDEPDDTYFTLETEFGKYDEHDLMMNWKVWEIKDPDDFTLGRFSDWLGKMVAFHRQYLAAGPPVKYHCDQDQRWAQDAIEDEAMAMEF